MRCMACGEKMVLIKAIEDWNMPVLGFERETYMCLGCGDIEHRTAFNKQIKEKHDAEIAAILARSQSALGGGRVRLTSGRAWAGI
jgi:hypothetical protein